MKQVGVLLWFIICSLGADISVYAQAGDSIEHLKSVDVYPTFRGSTDYDDFARYIASKLIYPDEAIRDSFEGHFTVLYLIDSTGRVTSPEIQDSVPAYIEKEIERVLLSSPQWTPGQYEGRNVNVMGAIPITFSLSSSEKKEDLTNQTPNRKRRKKKEENYP